jgi:hypothetical protein
VPASYSFQDGVLLLELAGIYSPNDVVRTYQAALSEPACPQQVFVLVDVSRSTSLASRTAEELHGMTALAAPYGDRIGHRYAVLAAPGVLFGMSRMGVTFSEAAGISGRVFTSREEAWAWLVGDAGQRPESG